MQRRLEPVYAGLNDPMDFLAILVDRSNEMAAGFVRVLPEPGSALVVAVITWAVAKALRRVLQRMLCRAALRITLINLLETLLSRRGASAAGIPRRAHHYHPSPASVALDAGARERSIGCPID